MQQSVKNKLRDSWLCLVAKLWCHVSFISGQEDVLFHFCSSPFKPLILEGKKEVLQAARLWFKRPLSEETFIKLCFLHPNGVQCLKSVV